MSPFDEPVSFNDNVVPACLPTDKTKSYAGESAIVSGKQQSTTKNSKYFSPFLFFQFRVKPTEILPFKPLFTGFKKATLFTGGRGGGKFTCPTFFIIS